MRRISILLVVLATCTFSILAQTLCNNATGFHFVPGSSSNLNMSSIGTANTSGETFGDNPCHGVSSCSSGLGQSQLVSKSAFASPSGQSTDGTTDPLEARSRLGDCTSSPYSSSPHCVSGRAVDGLLHRSTRRTRRAAPSFACQANQTCIVYGDLPICVDTNTGNFTDAAGGRGNYMDGTYSEGPGGNMSVVGTGSLTDSGSGSETAGVASATGGAGTEASSTTTVGQTGLDTTQSADPTSTQTGSSLPNPTSKNSSPTLYSNALADGFGFGFSVFAAACWLL